MSDEIRTYEQVARWLPDHIREPIAQSLPCADSGTHDWRHDRTDMHQWGREEPVYSYEWWTCGKCGMRTTIKPGADS